VAAIRSELRVPRSDHGWREPERQPQQRPRRRWPRRRQALTTLLPRSVPSARNRLRRSRNTGVSPQPPVSATWRPRPGP